MSSTSFCCARSASLSVFDWLAYLQVSLAHHCARVTIVTPGKLHEAAETNDNRDKDETIPITIFLYISMYIKIKQDYHKKKPRFFNRKNTFENQKGFRISKKNLYGSFIIMPKLSPHFQNRKPSSIRMAQIEFLKRTDKVHAINVSIGDVSLPMHPKMQERMFHLDSDQSPFNTGVVPYSLTKGFEETNKAFLNIIAASGYETTGLYSQITDGGSLAMELITIGCCGPAGTKEQPLLLIDAAYTNYMTMANRLGRTTISVQRNLQSDGTFTLPDIAEIERTIIEHKP